MKQKLDKLLENAYGRYSDVKVSAIAVDAQGREFSGVNVENSAYPSSMCAERVAINTAVTNGAKEIKEVHLTSSLEKVLYPCGACLQVMLEFMSKDGKVVMYNKDQVITKTLGELIPNGVTAGSFGWE